VKTCKNCKIDKDKSEFYPSPTKRDPQQVMAFCKVCHVARTRARHAADPQRHTELTVFARYRKLGLTREKFWEMWIAQDGLCALPSCGVDLEQERGMVDHCHATGAIRGILCRQHNMALGLFADRPDVLREAAAYLEVEREAPVTTPDDVCRTQGCANLRRPHKRICAACHAAAEKAARVVRKQKLSKLPCQLDGCDEPRHVMPSQVSPWCAVHHRAQAKVRRETQLTDHGGGLVLEEPRYERVLKL
jgi:hypothetical protein